MKAIWKYQLKVTEEQEISLPIGAQILTVQELVGIPCIWVLVDPLETMKEIKTIRIVGTGHPADDVTREQYLGTVQICSISGHHLVWHVFVK